MNKIIAYGAGTLLHNYLKMHPNHGISYIVVTSSQEEEGEFMGIPIYPVDKLNEENLSQIQIVIFAACNDSRRDIGIKLNSMGLGYRSGYIDSADLFLEDFKEKVMDFIGKPVDMNNYIVARSHYNNSHTDVLTTVCGNWLLLECLKDTDNLEISGDIVELGSHTGGNAVLMLQTLCNHKSNSRKYFILDSFEGFPEISSNDPKEFQNIFDMEYNFMEIKDRFAMFDNCHIIRGFIPTTFQQLPEGNKYSLIFYDCDLYQTCLDTLEYFYDKVVPGGYIIVHDYLNLYFGGVKKAVDKFCSNRGVEFSVFFESTMAGIKIPLL